MSALQWYGMTENSSQLGLAENEESCTFSVGNFVSVKIPMIDRTPTDLHRVPSVVVEILGKENHLYRLRCVLFVI